MFVVRMQNDEATLFRAFRHLSSARRWAVERNDDDSHSVFDILDVPNALEASSAVAAARGGMGVLVHRVEAVSVPAWVLSTSQNAAYVPGDHAFV